MKKLLTFKKVILSAVIIMVIFGCSESQSNNETVNKDIRKKADSMFAMMNKELESPVESNANEPEEVSAIKTETSGKPDTIVIEFDENNRLLIPGMTPSPFADENPTPDMYVNYTFLQKHDSIFFNGIVEPLEGNELFFETNKDFEIISTDCNAFAGIFFNEDGSGGTWREFGETPYGKESAKQIEEKIYEVPLFEGALENIPDEILEKADSKLDENELLSYEPMISKVIIDIQYILKGKKNKKVFVFKYEYGD